MECRYCFGNVTDVGLIKCIYVCKKCGKNQKQQTLNKPMN